MLVLKVLIFNSFYFGCAVITKELIFNIFYLGGCGGLERTDFSHFLLCDGVVVLKELMANSFYFGRMWWS